MPAHPGQPAPPGCPAAADESRPDLGIASILARKHRLVLRYTDGIAGLTDPELHILGPAQIRVATTDGTVYRLASAREYPTADPAAAAALISRELAAAAPAPPQ